MTNFAVPLSDHCFAQGHNQSVQRSGHGNTPGIAVLLSQEGNQVHMDLSRPGLVQKDLVYKVTQIQQRIIWGMG